MGQTSQNLHGTPEPGCSFREGFINAWRRGPCGRPAQGGGARGGPVCVPCGRLAQGSGARGGPACVPCVKPVQGSVAGTRPVRRRHPRSHSSAANISTPEGQGARNLDSHLEFFVLEVEFCYRLKRLPCRSDRAPGGQGAALGPTSEQHFF